MAPRRLPPAPSRASASPAGQWNAIPFGTAAGAGAGTPLRLVPRLGTSLEPYSVWYHGLRAETVVRSGMRFQRAPAEWYQTQYRSTPAVLTAKPSQIIRPLCPSAA